MGLREFLTKPSGLAVSTTLGGLVVSMVIIWLFAPAMMSIIFDGNLERMGQAGDLFGSVNALFSGLAFAGLFWTVLLQREQLALQQTELALQREELKLQREEMKSSREELANQAQAQRSLVAATYAQIRATGAVLNVEAMKVQVALAGHYDEKYRLVEAIKEQAKIVVASVDGD
jgi:hypothetical protein